MLTAIAGEFAEIVVSSLFPRQALNLWPNGNRSCLIQYLSVLKIWPPNDTIHFCLEMILQILAAVDQAQALYDMELTYFERSVKSLTYNLINVLIITIVAYLVVRLPSLTP